MQTMRNYLRHLTTAAVFVLLIAAASPALATDVDQPTERSEVGKSGDRPADRARRIRWRNVKSPQRRHLRGMLRLGINGQDQLLAGCEGTGEDAKLCRRNH